MSVFKLIFIFGIVITIFNVIWFFFEWLFKLLIADTSNQNKVNTLIKIISISLLSILLAHESNLFVIKHSITDNFEWFIKVSGAFVLYLYVVGKAEEKKLNIFSSFNQMNVSSTSPYPKWLPYLGIVLYALGLFLPELSSNVLTNWFHSNIFDIYNTFFLKLIFGIIAFFFMLNIIGKAFSSFLNFGARKSDKTHSSQIKDENDFDDYEIVDDNKLNE